MHPVCPTLECTPIGVVRSPFGERAEAPHQPVAARDVPGRIELFPGHHFEHALEDLETWSHLWVIFWFHHNADWRPKVLPPRSTRRRGVFATRSPHRPNPIGLSSVSLERIEGLTLFIRGVDMLDGTPVLDLKPYVPHVDRLDESSDGWLGEEHDPKPRYALEIAPTAALALDYLRRRWNLDLEPRLRTALERGPAPHPYRRIKREGETYVLGLKAWRVRFEAGEHHVRVLEVRSGYRASELGAPDPALDVHRDFTSQTFGVALE